MYVFLLEILRDFSRKAGNEKFAMVYSCHVHDEEEKKFYLPRDSSLATYLLFHSSAFPPSALRARSNSHVPDGTDRKGEKTPCVRCVIRFFHRARIK